jgi:hypothetical protein
MAFQKPFVCRVWPVFVGLALLLSGCAATGPAFSPVAPSNDRALVYIYRSGDYMFGARDTYFIVDNKAVAELSLSGYTYFYATPGKHVLEQEWPFDIAITPFIHRARLDVEWKAGETYYYKFAPIMSLNRVVKSQALQEIRLTKWQQAYDFPDDEPSSSASHAEQVSLPVAPPAMQGDSSVSVAPAPAAQAVQSNTAPPVTREESVAEPEEDVESDSDGNPWSPVHFDM